MRVVLFILHSLFLLHAYSQQGTPGFIPNRINEERFITINGIEQWVTIKGDSTKPIVLFLHGGPGNPLSPFADAIYGNWEKDFVLVQWDQRGAGRTFGRNATEELTPAFLKANPLTIEQMTSDGIELSRYLMLRLGKRRIILFGTSWGSVLGVKMVLRNPELFYAYIGHSQVVNFNASLLNAYQQVYDMARIARDQPTLKILDSIGKPPYGAARTTGQLMRHIKKYQEKNSKPAPSSWFEVSAGYNNERDNQHRENSDDYSFVNYAGDNKLGVAAMSSTIDLLKESLVFRVPVYFIQGADDIQTPQVLTKSYYDSLTAPAKKFIVLPHTGHGFNQPVVDAHYQLMMQTILPLVSAD